LNMKKYQLLSFVLFLCLFSCSKDETRTYNKWSAYRAGSEAVQYSDLDQINMENVHLLEPAWIFKTGDAGDKTTIECNPIIIGNTMYITSPKLKLIALEADTGREIWQFDPFDGQQAGGVNRGVTYYKEGDHELIFLPAANYLYAVEAKTGKLYLEFGTEGRINLNENLGGNPDELSVGLSTPGIIYKDLIIIGASTGEGYNASPGHVRAYKARTGELEWIFHTIPKEGEYGYDTWEFIEGENYGGANNWSGMSLDEDRGWVFVSTGSPAFDFYGGNRLGENLFGNTVLALNALTGERIWHYQALHHDIWDYDLPCAPTLIRIPWEGGWKDALAQPTKMGDLIILDRETGEPLLSNEETLVPGSNLPGEMAHPTQNLHHGIQLATRGIDPEKLTNISQEANAYARDQLKQYRNEGMYTPPSLEGSIAMPGPRGGSIWGGASYNPHSNMMFLNVNQIPMILQVKKVASKSDLDLKELSGYSHYMLNCSSCHGADLQGMPGAFPGLTDLGQRLSKKEIMNTINKGKGLMPAFTQFDEKDLDKLATFLLEGKPQEGEEELPPSGLDRYALQGYRIFTDQEGFPGSQPPWGLLTAVDMNDLTIKWEVPLGYYPELKARNIPDTGTMTYGGCVATAGDLVFIGGTADELFRAFDANTGEELWQYQLPAGGYAVPSVYEVDGKQYVVIAAGGGNRMGTPSGDTFIAFALPDSI
jgi:quinoprotein glucose dehydrogenase